MSRRPRLFPGTTPRVTSAPVTDVPAATGIPTTSERSSSRTTSPPWSSVARASTAPVGSSVTHHATISVSEISRTQRPGRLSRTWTEQYEELGADPRIGHVQELLNGAEMGASNPHPHGQIWATEHVPMIVAREQEALGRSPVLLDYLDSERERIVVENEHFVAVVPYWAVWPFETLVIARRRVSSLLDLDDEERMALGPVLKNLVRRYDGLFGTPFPYSMGIHQAPTTGAEARERSHLHLHFYPPLLAIGDHPQVHGRVRVARRASAGHHTRGSSGASTGGAGLRYPSAPATASQRYAAPESRLSEQYRATTRVATSSTWSTSTSSPTTDPPNPPR